MGDRESFLGNLKVPTDDPAIQEAIDKFATELSWQYKSFIDNPQIKNYFNHVVAAIMISQYEDYEQSGINIPYRYKSFTSIQDKVKSRIPERASITRADDGSIIIKDFPPLMDIFAMEIVSRRRPTILTSNDPEIQKLLDEEKYFQEALGGFQAFKSKLLIDDLKKEKPGNYKYDCTQVDYYNETKKLLEKLKEIVEPSATDLIADYDEKLALVEDRLNFLESSPNEKVTLEDFEDPSVNFFRLLSELESRVHNKVELAILTRQITSLFDNNVLLKKLGVTLANVPVEKKRTKRGYEANFIYFDTPVRKNRMSITD